ncbi:unnamed protein product [Paramecium primaurelia]|uniref:Uncharacterized protein n=1 Tax=Paramecium primaurelia TaxID=5886 RepID=A0A8S1NG92_PARPR|nr:unnamed protein product [Paramecium primaurelia]
MGSSINIKLDQQLLFFNVIIFSMWNYSSQVVICQISLVFQLIKD